MVPAIMTSTSTNPGLAPRIRHAETYPFARPSSSYLFKDGGMHPLVPGFALGRVPVIASGSNAATDRLAAKFGRDSGPIPVTKAKLRDFVVTFAGHFTAYGAMPATLCPCPGAVCRVWITWLTVEQLSIMHRSEGVAACREVEQRYDYIELAGLALHPDRLAPIAEAGAYLARRMLTPEGRPIRLAETPAWGCPFRAGSQRSTLRVAWKLLAPASDFAAFMHLVLSGPEQRQTLFERLTPYTTDRAATDDDRI